MFECSGRHVVDLPRLKATFIALDGSRERNGWAALSAGMHVADEETGDWLVRTVDAVLIVSVLVVAFTVMLAAFPA
jgi:hypothetical protein